MPSRHTVLVSDLPKGLSPIESFWLCRGAKFSYLYQVGWMATTSPELLSFVYANNFCPMKLQLNTISIHNFKSYKGTHIISKLDPQFTAIVGPNGSGKSNIIDSILFVLGFRAKKMRHICLTDLIYSDGVRESMCYVTLHFNKFSITRQLLCSKSKYLLNDREVSVSEVISLMNAEGVDMDHNRFLILQGEIENISLMKPLQLLEYLEDIIGTSSYKSQIEESKNQVKLMEDEVEGKKVELGFYQKEFTHVEKVKNEVQDKLKSKLDVIELKVKVNTILLEKLEREKTTALKSKQEIKNELQKISEKNKLNTEVIANLEGDCKKAKVDFKNKELELLDVKKEHRIVERYNSSLRESKAKLEKKIKALQAELEDKRARKEIQGMQGKMYRKEIEDNESEVKSYQKEADKLKKLLSSEQKKVNTVKLNSKLKEEEQKLLVLLDEKAKICSLIDRNTEQVLALKDKKEYLENEAKLVASKISLIESKSSMINSLVCDKDSKNNKKLCDITQEKLIGIKGKLNSELFEISSDILQSQKEFQRRKLRSQELKDNEERSNREQEVDSHVSSIKGVYGRLRSLGTIEPRYNIALSTASKNLSSIVVDTTATAEECIGLIKKYKLGRTTFIILDKLGQIPRQSNEAVPYLYECIKCDKMFMRCFYFALKDTLVTDTLENAEKLAFSKQRKRVVTLCGKLIEKSGVMSGGKTGKAKNIDELECALERMHDIKKKKEEEIEIIDLCMQYGKLAKSHSELSADILMLSKAIEEKNSVKNVVSWIVNKLFGTHPNSQHFSPNMHSWLTSSANFKSIDEVSEFFESRISEVKVSIQSVKRQLEEFLSTEVKMYKGSLEILNDKIRILEQRNQEIKVQLASMQNYDIEQLEIESTNHQRTLSNFAEETDMSGLRLKLEKIETEYKEKLNDYKILYEKLSETKLSMGNDYHLEIDLKNQLDDTEDKVADINKQKISTKKHIKELEKEKSYFMSICTKSTETNELLHEDEKYALNDASNTLSYTEVEDEELDVLYKKEVKRLCKSEESVVDNINLSIFEEFYKAKSIYTQYKSEYTYMKDKHEKLKLTLDSLTKSRHDEFTLGFSTISKNLKDIYKNITYGGNAELELVDYLDPFTEGVILSIMPPKKSWKSVSNLSGGERTLSSLALIFALHKYKPSPFYVMDEIDAALDYRNVGIVSRYIREMAMNAQFLVISLRNDMFELSDTLVGVYKNNGLSKCIVVDLQKIKL